MIAVAVAVIAGVIAVTCGIVADSNHADSLTFLGVMVKTTAAQIFLAGAICTWALFASLWLLSVGVRRSKERGIELRALKTLRTRRLPRLGTAMGLGATNMATIAAGTNTGIGLSAGADADTRPDYAAASAHSADAESVGSARAVDAESVGSARAVDAESVGSAHAVDADSEPTIEFDILRDFSGFGTLDHLHTVVEPGLGRHAESGRFYRANPSN